MRTRLTGVGSFKENHELWLALKFDDFTMQFPLTTLDDSLLSRLHGVVGEADTAKQQTESTHD